MFERLKTTATFTRGETLFHESDACYNVFVVCSGAVKLTTSSTEGKVLLLRIVGPGEILGMAEAVLGHAPYECSAVALDSSVVATIPGETFVRFVSSYPEASLRLTVALSEQYKSAQRETRFLAFGDTSTARLAHLLMEWSAERGETGQDGVHIRAHMTHTDLAQAIGTTRETVTRVLGDLSHRGILERTADEIVIHRAQELSSLAVF